MSNQIDNLFKKKLEGHSIEPGPNVWSKVSASSSKKNRAVIWFRAAAALLLMVSAFWLYNNTNDNSSSEIAVATPEELRKEEPVTIHEEVDATESLEEDKTIQTSLPPSKSPKVASIAKKDEKSKTKIAEPLRIELTTEPLESIAQVDPILLENTIDIKEPDTSSKPIVIIYELKSYAKNNEQESELEPLLQKKNGLKKVLDVANNIRTGESPLGGLRQAKEDLFALNFKKEEKTNR